MIIPHSPFLICFGMSDAKCGYVADLFRLAHRFVFFFFFFSRLPIEWGSYIFIRFLFLPYLSESNGFVCWFGCFFFSLFLGIFVLWINYWNLISIISISMRSTKNIRKSKFIHYACLMQIMRPISFRCNFVFDGKCSKERFFFYIKISILIWIYEKKKTIDQQCCN